VSDLTGSSPGVAGIGTKAKKQSDARRQSVLKLPGDADFAVPEEWVVVGDPQVPGLRGEEAIEIHRKMLRGTQSVSAGPPGGNQGGPQNGIQGILGGMNQPTSGLGVGESQ
jgi:hypothetical protein